MKPESEPQLPGLADTTKLSLAPAKGREEPAVWLRKLAVHSDWPAATGTLLREIALHRGLNVLWAEPAPRGTKNRVSGHATGKTTFCRLVRYLLADADAGTKDFRQRFQAKFPRGWVLGEVVVGGVPWLVGRPLGHQGFHPFARKNGTLADATGAQPLRGNFEDYEAALAEVTLGQLTLRNLSGTNRELKWDGLLQWLARDQEARFADLLEWRHKSSDYESPALVDADKENLVRIILGLVDGPEQKLLREHAEKSAEHRRLVDDRPSRAYFAERQRLTLKDLAKQEVAKPDDPLLLQAIKTQAKTWRDAAKKARAALRDEEKDKKLQDALASSEAQVLLATLAVEEAKRELSQLQGTLYSTQQSAEKEQQLNELRDLKPFKGFCSAPLEEALREGCKLAALRQSDSELDRALKQAKTQAERQEVIVKRQRQECSRLAQILKDRTKARDAANSALQKFHEDREKKMEKADAPRLRAEALEAALQNYQIACDELETLEKKLTSLDKGKRNLDKQLEQMEAQHNRRILEFSRIYDHFAKRLLGNDVTASIKFSGKAIEPAVTYHGPYDSTALKLAKFLVFDLSALALGVTGSGHHPRFLLHDSPREADLTEAIYEELFRAAVELEAGAKEGEAPFQYIVTTTQPPPDELKQAPWLLQPVLNATEAKGRFLGVDL